VEREKELRGTGLSTWHQNELRYDDMNMNYADNLSQALLQLQESLNEIITNCYQLGVRDGYELALKGGGEQASELSEDIMTKYQITGLDSPKPNVLQEAEKILRDCSQDFLND
jgi:hypothetical protein